MVGHPYWACPQGKGFNPYDAKGKGKSPKGKGKRANKVESDYESWAQINQEDDDRTPKQGLGGSEIGEVQSWSAPVCKSRSRNDMRPEKPSYKSIVLLNLFSALGESSNAPCSHVCTKSCTVNHAPLEKSIVPNLRKHVSPVHPVLNRRWQSSRAPLQTISEHQQPIREVDRNIDRGISAGRSSVANGRESQ